MFNAMQPLHAGGSLGQSEWLAALGPSVTS